MIECESPKLIKVHRGPYPSVWAMLAIHHSPLNKDRAPPKVLSTTQTIYKRTGVDANSRWRLEWEGVGQADLTTDLTCSGLKDTTVAVQCEEGDILVECEQLFYTFLTEFC